MWIWMVLIKEAVFYAAIDNGFIPGSKVHGANMGPTWGRQDPGEP